jgi:NAD(P)-dependent dehydrogenase (short-subunit alcohol dehydrogenase family)
MRLKDKVALVTGASRGLGKAIAVGLAQAGAKVVVAARTEVKTPQLTGSIQNTVRQIKVAGGEAVAIKCDVTDEAQIRNMTSKVLDLFGRIDILVNNAGIAFRAPVWEMPLKRWDLVLRVNLTGPFLCTQAVLPGMMSQKAGSIINISSIQADRTGSVNTGIAYPVSKAGLERLTLAMAAELKPYNIAVNCLKPRGAVDTEGMRFVHPQAERSRWDSPEMMVRSAVFLAGQDAAGVTGTVATDEEVCRSYGLYC